MSYICRLCLQVFDSLLEALSEDDTLKLRTLFPAMDLNLVDSPVACPNCITILQQSYAFRETCLNTENIIKSYMAKTKESLVDLNEIVHKSNLYDIVKSEDQQIKMECFDNDKDLSENFGEFFNADDIMENVMHVEEDCLDLKNEETLTEDVRQKTHKKRSLPKLTRTHKKRVTCKYCRKSFSSTQTRKKHINRLHQNLVVTEEEEENIEEDGNDDKETNDLLNKMNELKELDEEIDQMFNRIFDDTENVQRNYICELCSKSYQKRNRLTEHLRTHFEKFVCCICNNYFCYLNSLKKHLKNFHDIDVPKGKVDEREDVEENEDERGKYEESEKVNEGGKDDNGERNDNEIIKEEDKSEKVHASLKENSWKSKVIIQVDEEVLTAVVQRHLNVYFARNVEETENDGSSPEFKCTICKMIFSDKSQLSVHVKNHFKRPMCKTCKMHCFNLNFLLIHMTEAHKKKLTADRVHDLISEYSVGDNLEDRKCKTCGMVFANKTTCNRHALVHDELQYTCEYCGKTFRNKYRMQCHVNSEHLGKKRKRNTVKKYTCDACGLSTANKFVLVQHLRVHTGEKPFECDECGKRFSQKSSLGTHKRCVHSDERLFTCEYCSKNFNAKGSLTKHILEVHLVDKIEKKYQCSYCGKKYRLQSQLNAHVKWHTNERDFCCDLCGRTFVDMHSVKKHRVTHFEDKKHKCEICGKGFHQKYNIKIHMKVHKIAS